MASPTTLDALFAFLERSPKFLIASADNAPKVLLNLFKKLSPVPKVPGADILNKGLDGMGLSKVCVKESTIPSCVGGTYPPCVPLPPPVGNAIGRKPDCLSGETVACLLLPPPPLPPVGFPACIGPETVRYLPLVHINF